MELTAGQPYWLINSGLLYSYPKLDKDYHAHVAIIGGGISGALSAYFLTEAGLPCILLDSRTIGLGSTCASTSLIQYELDVPLHQLILKKGTAVATRSYQLCYESVVKLLSFLQHIRFPDFEKNSSLYDSSSTSIRRLLAFSFTAISSFNFSCSAIVSLFCDC